MKRIIILLLSVISLSNNAFSQSTNNVNTNNIYRPSYIDSITYQYYLDDPNAADYPDYFLLLHVKYKKTEKDIIVTNESFVHICFHQFKLMNTTARDFIKDAMINNKTIYLPPEKKEKINKGIYNTILETDYIDTVINNKEDFLNYYFDENKKFKRELSFQTYEDTEKHYNNVHANLAGVIAQLIKWNIPVYLKDGLVYYGYHWEK